MAITLDLAEWQLVLTAARERCAGLRDYLARVDGERPTPEARVRIEQKRARAYELVRTGKALADLVARAAGQPQRLRFTAPLEGLVELAGACLSARDYITVATGHQMVLQMSKGR